MDWQTEKATKSIEAQAKMREAFVTLAEREIIIDSGRRRPNRYGDLETVYVLASDGHADFVVDTAQPPDHFHAQVRDKR